MPVLSLPGTPDLLKLHACWPQRYPVLLETASGGGWDILLGFPGQPECFDATSTTDVYARLAADWQAQHCPTEAVAAHLPFRGGWFVYLGYETLHALEPSVARREADSRFPDACLMRIPAAILVNRATAQTWLFAESDSAHLLADMQHDLATVPSSIAVPVQLLTLAEEAAPDFLAGIARIQQYIREGDVFQVNLSRRWHGQLRPGASPADVYRALRRANPAPFGGLARLGARHSIVSSSPERLVQVQSGKAQTRPIAGTYPRHADPTRDAQTRAELAAHPKERAEHVMLVDLERNDLGRVCVPGSVKVDELMAVATYTHVHHIESSVSGMLRDDVSPAAALRALFPGGTITGCPKVRTMQIIRELETSPRQAYTGSMGYVNLDGDMDMNILIRSMMLSDDHITFSAGAGIVADSDPLRELQETRAKARGLLSALGVVG